MKLKKELTLIDIFSVATGALISSGLFILPGLARGLAGPAVVMSYFLAGLLATTGMLSIAEITTAMPKAGGDYFFIMRSFGPGMGTVAGLLSWFALSMKTAFALIGMAAFTALIPGFRNINISYIAVTLCVVFTLLNITGVKKAGRTQVWLVMGLLTVLGFYLIRGLPEINVGNFENFTPHGLRSVFTTAGFVFTAYGGLLGIASISEEVKNPGKTIPRGLILSIVVTTILYVLVVFVAVGVIASADFDPESLTPISDAASMFMGNPGIILLGAAAVLAFISTANAGILSASRYLLGLSRDGLIPGSLKSINEKFHTPHFPILITGGFLIGVLFLELEVLVKATSAGIILTNIFANLCLIILRESRVQNYKPSFKTPLYPWIQIAGIAGFSLLLTGIGREAFIASSLLFASGLILYRLFGHTKTSKESALLHLIERITNKELQSGMLEFELKEIIRERDEMKRDRFDEVIEKCAVLDFEEETTLEEFFKLAAEKLSERVDVSKSEIFRLLTEREKQGSTEIEPGIAVPHIVVEGKKIFDVLLARSKKGIIFDENMPPVKTAFLLIGSMDERNFHLRTLSALAQTIQDKHFMNRWLAAKNQAALRDIILLGKRKRPGEKSGESSEENGE